MKLCSCCGTEPPAQSSAYCPDCKNSKMRAWRVAHPLAGEARRRMNCRAYTHVLVKRGHLEKTPCEVCEDPNVEAHHDDYSKPRVVRWLCKAHHRALHAGRAPANQL